MVLPQADEPDRTPKAYLVRHGETAWTISGQHTDRTDIQLTERGERDARELSVRLRGMTFANVLVSPLQRASLHIFAVSIAHAEYNPATAGRIARTRTFIPFPAMRL